MINVRPAVSCSIPVFLTVPFFCFVSCSQKYLLGFIKQEKYNYINMKSESQKKTCTAKMVIKVTVGTKMRGKVI